MMARVEERITALHVEFRITGAPASAAAIKREESR
jgi:hypothetical protein